MYLPVKTCLLTPLGANVYLLFGFTALLMGQLFWGFCLIMGGCIAQPQSLLALKVLLGKQLSKRPNPFLATLILGVLIGIFSGLTLALSLATPAHAQFFQNAEDFFNGIDGIDDGIVTLLMLTVRGIFILYLLFALVQVINAARREEDWKEVGKTPFLVLMIGSFGDVLIGAIAGT